MSQQEIFIPHVFTAPKWVDAETVNGWQTWRDAVLWCWKNRPNRCSSEAGDQAMFRQICIAMFSLEPHAPHISRWVNPNTKAPMDLHPDYVEAFESFTGWRGLTQRFNRKAKTTCLEEVQARMAA